MALVRGALVRAGLASQPLDLTGEIGEYVLKLPGDPIRAFL
jgi:hypothetical protein